MGILFLQNYLKIKKKNLVNLLVKPVKQSENIKREMKPVLSDMNFEKVLTKKNELDNVNDLWYFVKSSKNRWIAGSAH